MSSSVITVAVCKAKLGDDTAEIRAAKLAMRIFQLPLVLNHHRLSLPIMGQREQLEYLIAQEEAKSKPPGR